MDILLLPNVLLNVRKMIIEKIAHNMMRRHHILLKEKLPPETNY
jgi:hypothetical protein